MITRRTRTPASAAPSLFEPTATVYRPQRVNVSTIWPTTTITSAQISSEYVPSPRTFANVETWLTVSVSTMCAPLITWGTLTVEVVTCASGNETGWPCEMISVKTLEREQHAERRHERVDAHDRRRRTR